MGLCVCVFQAADAPHAPAATWVKEGGMVLLGKRHLQAAFKGVGSDDIVYTIDVSEGKPKHGTTGFIHRLHNVLLIFFFLNWALK